MLSVKTTPLFIFYIIHISYTKSVEEVYNFFSQDHINSTGIYSKFLLNRFNLTNFLLTFINPIEAR